MAPVTQVACPGGGFKRIAQESGSMMEGAEGEPAAKKSKLSSDVPAPVPAEKPKPNSRPRQSAEPAARRKSKSKKRRADRQPKKKKKKSVQGRAVERRRLKQEEKVVVHEEDDVPSDIECDEDEVDDEDAKVYHRTKKRNRKTLKKFDEMPIYIVDEHDGSMVAALRQIELGYLPLKGMTLLHFDSHPDLGNIPDENFGAGFDDLWKQKYSIRELYNTTDIATWITPMVLAGHFDTVIWACGHWCDQFHPGTYHLLVGKDKNDQRIKVGTPGNKKRKCLEYWESGGTTCDIEDFEYYRPWTLHVVRYGKNCRLPDRQHKLLHEELSSGTWVLDIDEDFFSCNNPYFDEFRDLFGEKLHKMVKNVYIAEDDDSSDLEEALMKMFRQRLYTKPWSTFSKSAIARDLLQSMGCEKKKAVLKQFHAFVRKHWPKGGMVDPSSDEEADMENLEGWDVRDFFTLDDLHQVGQLACLPHHVSTAKEIQDLANEVDGLFDQLPPPAIITVATSRLDRYLPDSQAATIHGLLETLLTNRFGTETVLRLDKPKFSVNNGSSADDLEEVGGKHVEEILAPEPEA